MTTPLQSHDHTGTLQRTEWCLGLAEATITTVTDPAFVGQVGRNVRPLSADVPSPERRLRKEPAGRAAPAGIPRAVDLVLEAECLLRAPDIPL